MRDVFAKQTMTRTTATPSVAKPAEHKRINALSALKRNEQCRVLTIAGGEGMRSKMYNLGVHETERVKVVQNRGFGPLVIDIGGTRLILGRKMAERLWVSRI